MHVWALTGASHDSPRTPFGLQLDCLGGRPQKREERTKIVAGDETKKRHFWDPHPSGPPPYSLRGPIFMGSLAPPFQAPAPFFSGFGPSRPWAEKRTHRRNPFCSVPMFFFSPFFFFLLRCFFCTVCFLLFCPECRFFLSCCVFLCPGTRTSTFLCLCQIASADVPVRSTLMATIAQACGRTGVLGGRGFRLESAAARRGCSGGATWIWTPVAAGA